MVIQYNRWYIEKLLQYYYNIFKLFVLSVINPHVKKKSTNKSKNKKITQIADTNKSCGIRGG